MADSVHRGYLRFRTGANVRSYAKRTWGRMRPYVQGSLVFLLYAIGSSTLARPPAAIPAGALASANAVNVAASHRDFAALRKLMVEDFVWSFGGDASAEQAIGEWKSNPNHLAALRKATSGACDHIGNYVQCPANAGVSYRAGFALTPDGWRFAYFVAGD